MALNGSILQLINSCKTTIEGWINTIAAKYLPLSGGTVNGDVNINATTTTNILHVNEPPNVSGAITISRTGNTSGVPNGGPYIDFKILDITKGEWPATGVTKHSDLFFYSNDNSIGENRYGAIESYISPTRIGMSMNCYTNEVSTQNDNIGIMWNKDNGFWTYAPHPKKLDTSTNTFVLNTADSSNKIATTYWIRQALPNLVGGTFNIGASSEAGTGGTIYQKYIKFPNGYLICHGTLWGIQPGDWITFLVPFIQEPSIVATRHYGSNNGADAGFSYQDTESAPLHVYNTSNYTTSGSTRNYTGFRIGVYESKLNWGTDNKVYGMWIAIGRWK